jgi:hypothetical protein
VKVNIKIQTGGKECPSSTSLAGFIKTMMKKINLGDANKEVPGNEWKTQTIKNK